MTIHSSLGMSDESRQYLKYADYRICNVCIEVTMTLPYWYFFYLEWKYSVQLNFLNYCTWFMQSSSVLTWLWVRIDNMYLQNNPQLCCDVRVWKRFGKKKEKRYGWDDLRKEVELTTFSQLETHGDELKKNMKYISAIFLLKRSPFLLCHENTHF